MTPTLSVDAVQSTTTLVRVELLTARPPGVVGGVVSRAKSARIEVSGPTAKVHDSCVLAQTPFQPSKSEPSSAFAVSVIVFPKP